MSLERRRPMKRGAPLKRGPGPKRKGRLRQQSAKRQAERSERAEVVAIALARDGGCVARDLTPPAGAWDGWPPRCWGPLDGDEIVNRSQRPGGHLDPENVQTLCRGHHIWKGDHPEAARQIGLARRSWEP